LGVRARGRLPGARPAAGREAEATRLSALIVDTSGYSEFLRGDARAIAALAGAQEIHVPLIVLGELLAGFAAGSRTQSNREKLDRFMASHRVSLMRPDERTARMYADVYADLRRAGRPIPTNDLWIAALARQHRMPLLTFDAHFRQVPGVSLVNEV